MDIEGLRTFVEVADAGGVSAAASRMGVSKSIVSRRLNRIEAELGVQLVARSTRGAALTEAGLAFRDHAAQACAELDLARDEILPAGDPTGRLRIAAPLSFGPTHLAPILAEMSRRYPRLHIHTCYSDQVIDIIAGGYDCAIRLGYLQDSNLIARRVGPLHGRLVASPAYIAAHGAPARPEDVPAHEALLQGTETWQFMDGTKVVTVKPQGRSKADNGSALVAAALAGLGILIIPEGLVQDHLKSGALLPIMPDYPVREAGIYVVRPPGKHPARKVSLLTELLIEGIGRNPEVIGEAVA